MKKQIATIILGIMFLTLASAYFPGETLEVNHNFGSSDITLSVIDNSTFINVTEFGLESNLTHAKIIIPQSISPDEFKIVLTYLKEQEVKTVVVHHSGSSRTKYVNRNVTEYVTVTEFIEKIKYLENNATAFDNIGDLEIPEIKTEKSKWFLGKFWNWLKELFK